MRAAILFSMNTVGDPMVMVALPGHAQVSSTLAAGEKPMFTLCAPVTMGRGTGGCVTQLCRSVMREAGGMLLSKFQK
jgi:hypothetical protein